MYHVTDMKNHIRSSARSVVHNCSFAYFGISSLMWLLLQKTVLLRAERDVRLYAGGALLERQQTAEELQTQTSPMGTFKTGFYF